MTTDPSCADPGPHHQRHFALLAMACGAAAALLPLGYLGFWLAAPVESLATSSPLGPQAFASFGLSDRLGAAAIGAVPLALLIWGLLRVRHTFLAFARGTMFASNAIAGLRDFAIGVGGSAVLKPLVTLVLGLYLTRNAPDGQHQLVLMLGSDTVLFVLFAATFLATTIAMRQAALLAEENRQFV